MTVGPFALDRLHVGDALELCRALPEGSVHCCVTSPPYFGLRSYLPGDDPAKAAEIGAEPTLAEYIGRLVVLFREIRRALRGDGTCWLNLGDSYANDGKWGGASGGKHATGLHGETGVGRGRRDTGLKPKDLMLVPFRVALALQEDGWWLRSHIVWAKPNPMPESVTDRPTAAHEEVFLLTKLDRYWYDAEAVKEPAVSDHDSGNGYARPERVSLGGRGQEGGWTVAGSDGRRNRRNVWTMPTAPYPGSHYAVMPPALAAPCIRAGCPRGGIVLDPFMGSGTVAQVAQENGRRWLGFDLDSRNAALVQGRTGVVHVGAEDALRRPEPGALPGQASLWESA